MGTHRGPKFTDTCDGVFSANGTHIVVTPIGAPRANAICERVVGTLRRECLDRLLIFGTRQLEAVLSEYLDHYNSRRPHQSLGQQAPTRTRRRSHPSPAAGSSGVISSVASSTNTHRPHDRRRHFRHPHPAGSGLRALVRACNPKESGPLAVSALAGAAT